MGGIANILEVDVVLEHCMPEIYYYMVYCKSQYLKIGD